LADRYCRNCGYELAEDEHYCANCGTPIQEAAHVPTPEADVPVPPPPEQQGWDTTSPPPSQQAEATSSGRGKIAGRLFVGCLVVAFALFALFVAVAIVGGVGGNSPSNQAADPDKQQQPSGDKKESKQAAGGNGKMKTAIVKVGGTPGMRFSGDVGNLDTSRSVDGVTPAQYEVKFSSDTWDMDSVYVSFYKETDANFNYPQGTLSVQIVVDGKVVQQSSSSARDGYVDITWSPS
jgi:hypothetical protein